MNTARTTARWDMFRGVWAGILETCWHTFALIVAIRHFDAGFLTKAALQAGFMAGLLATPLTVSIIARFGWRSARVCMAAMLVGMTGMGITAGAGNIWAFALPLIAAQLVIAQAVPLSTHIYATNYRSGERGRFFSTAMMINGLCGAAFYYIGGRWLDADLLNFRTIYVIGIAACALSALAYYKIPSQPLERSQTGNPWKNVSLVWKDKLFCAMLTGWMFMGMGNLMTLPLRVEYMANPVYGINATNGQIAIITGAVPLICRLLFTKIWGYFFDRMNMVTLRIFFNILFFFSMWLFFFTDKLWMMTLSMVFQGVAFAGGRVMWQLWTTRMVPHDKVTAYMSIHSALTGLRGTLAPFIGFALIEYSSPATAGWFAALIIGISTLIFIPLRHPIAERQKQGH